MNKNKAIQILNTQREKLKDLSNGYYCRNYMVETKSYIKDLLGENSEQFIFLKDYELNRPNNGEAKEVTEAYFKRGKIGFDEYLAGCIDRINNIGVYKAEKKNILSGIGNEVLASVFIPVIGGMFFLGNWIGNHTSDVQNYKNENTIKELNKTIESYKATNNDLNHKLSAIPKKS